MPSLKVTNSYKWLISGELELWGKIQKWSTQVVYRVTWENSSKVIKLLEWNDTISFLLNELPKKHWGFTCVYWRILDAISNTGVLMPKKWDVIEWSKDWRIVNWFIQTYYQWLKDSPPKKLPNLWQWINGGFTSETWHDRSSGYNDFLFTHEGVARFIDWDKYLLEVVKLLANQDLDTLEKKIKSIKIDS